MMRFRRADDNPISVDCAWGYVSAPSVLNYKYARPNAVLIERDVTFRR
jgi:hypothetical protein